jgi:hypothetical protein
MPSPARALPPSPPTVATPVPPHTIAQAAKVSPGLNFGHLALLFFEFCRQQSAAGERWWSRSPPHWCAAAARCSLLRVSLERLIAACVSRGRDDSAGASHPHPPSTLACLRCSPCKIFAGVCARRLDPAMSTVPSLSGDTFLQDRRVRRGCVACCLSVRQLQRAGVVWLVDLVATAPRGRRATSTRHRTARMLYVQET